MTLRGTHRERCMLPKLRLGEVFSREKNHQFCGHADLEKIHVDAKARAACVTPQRR